MVSKDSFARAYGDGFLGTVKFLGARCGSIRPEQAEEIAQAAWARGWEYRDTLRESSQLLPWVNTIALNIFRSECRVSWRRQDLDHDPKVEAPTFAALQAGEALRACSSKESRLLRARYVLGYSTNELAACEGVGQIAIRGRLSRARRRIRGNLANARYSTSESRRLNLPAAA